MIASLFKLSFWFSNNPPPLQANSSRIIFAVFAVLLVLGAIIRMVGSHREDDRHVTATFNKFGRMAVTMGILGLGLFFFSYQQIPFLGARFWYLFWGVGLIIWLLTIIRYITKIVPAERRQEAEQKAKEKYLPKRNPKS